MEVSVSVVMLTCGGVGEAGDAVHHVERHVADPLGVIGSLLRRPVHHHVRIPDRLYLKGSPTIQSLDWSLHTPHTTPVTELICTDTTHYSNCTVSVCSHMFLLLLPRTKLVLMTPRQICFTKYIFFDAVPTL